MFSLGTHSNGPRVTSWLLLAPIDATERPASGLIDLKSVGHVSPAPGRQW